MNLPCSQITVVHRKALGTMNRNVPLFQLLPQTLLQINVLKDAAAQEHLLIFGMLKELEHGQHPHLMKSRGNESGAHPFFPILQKPLKTRPPSPMTGWDGAPEWASYYDDAPPCQFTGRDLAPNVLRAFTSFYTDRESVQESLIAVWGRLASEFGGDPTVVGYDLLNEPAFAEQAPLTSGMLLGR